MRIVLASAAGRQNLPEGASRLGVLLSLNRTNSLNTFARRSVGGVGGRFRISLEALKRVHASSLSIGSMILRGGLPLLRGVAAAAKPAAISRGPIASRRARLAAGDGCGVAAAAKPAAISRGPIA